MDELRLKRLEKALERALRTLPSPAEYQADAARIVKVLHRWYGDEAGKILYVARAMLLEPDGCAVCGATVLADTEDWPAPLCVAHSPEAFLDAVGEMLREKDALRKGALKRG